jgi:hypothetical protein
MSSDEKKKAIKKAGSVLYLLEDLDEFSKKLKEIEKK